MMAHLVKGGGYHFLLQLFSRIDKTTDFGLDVRRSKCIHLILQLLQRCLASQLRPVLRPL
jgi:hypothetical protein